MGKGSLTAKAPWDGTALLTSPFPHPLLIQPSRRDTSVGAGEQAARERSTN